jgi:hypothetical protein
VTTITDTIVCKRCGGIPCDHIVSEVGRLVRELAAERDDVRQLQTLALGLSFASDTALAAPQDPRRLAAMRAWQAYVMSKSGLHVTPSTTKTGDPG